jgi:glycosyltransferase involved in cell wall biosynthesis
MVTGPVPDVTPYYDAAAVVLAPLRCGGGMRVKVLEALAAGKAVVATSLAVAGLSVVDHQEVRVADSAERFASATADLIEDVRIRAGLAERARAWACTHLDLRSRADAYGALYERLIAGVGATPAMRRRR